MSPLKRLIIIAIITSLSLISVNVSFAQDNNVPDNSTSYSDKIEYLDESLANLFDKNNIFPGFDDLFNQNSCKRQDLIALIKRRDGYGSLSRKAVIDSESTVLDIKKYIALWELSASELYFLRNLETLKEPNGEIILQSETLILYPDNPLITKDTVKNYLDYYLDRQIDYENCEYSFSDISRQWQQMVKKFNSSGNNFSDALNELGNSASELWSDIGNGLKEIKDNTVAIFDPGNEFQTPEFIEFNTDYGPFDQYLNESKKRISKVEKLTDKAVNNLVKESSNGDLIKILGDSARSVDQKYRLLEEELEIGNNYLEYNYADFVIASVWDQAGNTHENLANIAQSINPDNSSGLTAKLDLANTRQCRLEE